MKIDRMIRRFQLGQAQDLGWKRHLQEVTFPFHIKHVEDWDAEQEQHLALCHPFR